MKSWSNSKDYIQQVNNLSVEDYAASVFDKTEAPLPEHLTDWLGRLRLLYGLPFDYLVPDERLLPPESIRFFYIDRNWTDRMVDGALSVGKTTSREFSHHHAVFNKVMGALDDEERNIRTRFRETKSKAKKVSRSRLKGKTSAADMTGFLFRSQAVSGWTGLEVKAYRGEDPLTAKPLSLRLLRMDRLGPDILLCLFDGIPDIVDIEEPREGIQFGVQATLINNEVRGSEDCPSGLYMKLRHMEGDHAGYEVAWKGDDGEPIDGIPRTDDEQYIVSIPVRKANPQVLHIEALRDAVAASLEQIDADNPDNFQFDAPLTAAEFSVQMLQFPYQQRFKGKGEKAPLDNMPKFELASQYKGATIGITTAIKKLSDKEIKLLTDEAFSPVTRRGGQ